MSSKIAIIVCGNSGIDYMKHEYKIDVFRSILYVDEKEFEDFVDITAENFYQTLITYPETDVKTSQTATGKMLEVYKRLQSEGYTEALVVTIGSLLSGTYQNAVLASDMIDNFKVTVFDSKSVTYPEAKMALTAAKLVKAGKTVEQILPVLEDMRSKTTIYFAVDTLKYLIKNGRLSVAKGFIANLLKLKPLLWVNKDGKIESVEKIKTSNGARRRLLEKFFEETQGLEFEPFVIYTNNLEIAQDFVRQIKEKYPNIKEVPTYPLTPVVGAHAGPGAIALGYIRK
jgi:DegV family protein with EDD domain